ncbi:PAS domain S-box protein [Litoribacter ruber]|uniref:PAS domain S-box protein n=1 Tax=Litoribacter ruber TaxID=702568 RepID=UPI001BDB5E34|nr:PAS domain S-box protein [Litoribacter ruber]MBT0810297.1 PAS domain S-box protein [Litoribacter ruber]
MDKTYSQIFQHISSPAAICLADAPQFTLLDANPAYLAAVQAKSEDIIGKSVFKAFPDLGEDRNAGGGSKELYASLKKVVETGKEVKLPVFRYDIHDSTSGEVIETFWESHYIPLFGENNTVTRILAKIENVTDHVKTMVNPNPGISLLDEVDLKFKNIFDLASEGIALVDLEYNWKEVNPKSCEILGFSRWELLKKNFKQMTHPADLDTLDLGLKNLPESFKGEIRFYSKQGGIVWTFLSMNLVRKKDRSPYHYVAHLLDITEKKEIEIALQESEQRYQSLFLQNPDAVFAFDMDGRFASANEATLKLSESTMEALIGSYFLPLIPFEDKRRVYENFLQASMGTAITYETGLISAKGTERTLSVTNMPIKTGGKIIGVFGIAKDVTEKVKADQAIQKSRDQYEQLISTIDGIVWEANENLKTAFISPQSEKILGYKPKKWYANDNFWMEKIHTEDHQKFWKSFLEGMDQGGNFTMEYRMVGSLQQIVWIRNQVTVIKRPGRATVLRGVMSDITASKITAQELEIQQAKLSKIMERSLDVICTINEDGHFVDLSDACERVWGYTKEELTGVSFYNFVHPDDYDGTVNAMGEILTGKDIRSHENRYIHKNGHEVPMIWSAHYDPETKLIYSVASDITNRKAAEITMQLNERRYRALVQNGVDVVGIANSEGVYVYISDNIFGVTGYTAEELTGKNSESLIHPEDEHILIEALQNIHIQKQLTMPPHRFKKKDGTFIWVDTIVTNLLDDPAVEGLVFNSRDITHKIEAESALRISEEKYRLLFHSSPLPQWIFDEASLKFLDVNQTAINKYGYTREEFLSMTIKDIRPKENIPKLKKSLKKYDPSNGVHNYGVHTHLKKDGTPIKVEISGYDFHFRDKKGVMIVSVDVTERENALKQIQQHQQQLLTAQKMAHMGYWEVRVNEERLYWSEGVYEIWEINPDMSVDLEYFFSTVHPADLNYVREQVGKSMESGEPLDIEYRIQLSQFRTKWVQSLGKAVKDSKGNLAIFEGTVQDITGRKNVEAELAESNKRYELVISATSDAIYDWNLEKETILFGDGFYKIFGFKDQPFSNLSEWESKVHPNDRKEALQSIARFISSKEIHWECRYRFQRADGEYVMILDKAMAIRNQNQEAIRLVGAMEDITQQSTHEDIDKLRLTLADIFSEKDSPWKSLKRSLEEILAYTELDYGEIWLPESPGSAKLKLVGWSGSIAEETSYYILDTAQNGSLPGKIFNQKEIGYFKNIQSTPLFIRKDFAKANRLECAVGYPMIFNGEVFGVMLLFSKRKECVVEKVAPIQQNILDQMARDYVRKNAEHTLNLFFDLSEDILIISDFDGKVKKMNSAAETILGYSANELNNIMIKEAIHPEDLEVSLAKMQDSIKGKSIHQFENRIQTKSGQILRLSWTTSPWVEEKLMFSVARVIT